MEIGVSLPCHRGHVPRKELPFLQRQRERLEVDQLEGLGMNIVDSFFVVCCFWC